MLFTFRSSRRSVAFALVPMVLWLVTPALGVIDDLNVTLIERTPRYDYDAAKNTPAEGDTITFHGHIRYWGDADSPVLSSVDYEWRLDGATVATGTLSDFEPLRPPFDFDFSGYSAYPYSHSEWPYDVTDYDAVNPPTGWRVVTYTMTMPPAPDFSSPNPDRPKITLVVDPQDQVVERSEVNNQIDDFIHALVANFWVEESSWKYFHEYQHELGIGSNSWEDWIQRQMQRQNEYYEEAVWPISPYGVLDRVRIGRLIVVRDGELPLSGTAYPTNWPDRRDKTADLIWGFPAVQIGGSFYANHTDTVDTNPFYFEQSLLHELGHARYLIDNYGFNVHNVVDITEDGERIAGTHYMPWVWEGDLLYHNKNGGIMSGAYGYQWSPYEAAALNLIAGQRAVCGNYNAPCNIGEYLEDLPQNNHFQIVDQLGYPRAYANVRIYEAGCASGWYGKHFDDIYDQEYTADDQGYIHLPRNPFDPGNVDIPHGNGCAKGVFIARVQHGEQVWFRFVEATDFNMQYWQGNTQDAYYELTCGGAQIDSDGDGMRDDWEFDHFGTVLNDGVTDEEPDGLTNLQEYQNETDPLDPDSDDDNLTDGQEVLEYMTDPNSPDTDADSHQDDVDNCPRTYNPGQEDANDNGIGDVCETLPRVDRAMLVASNEALLRFSKPVDAIDVENVANYSLNNGASVLSALLHDDLITAAITTSTLQPDTDYVLTLSGIRDLEDPPQEIIPGTQVMLGYSSVPRVADGLVVAYDFDEAAGTAIADVSGVDPALDFVISDPQAVSWTLGGIELVAPTLIVSDGPATKIHDACTATNEFTLEAWIRPSVVNQFGPARIVTMSWHDYTRNFTLGQGLSGSGSGDVYDMRLRTTVTSSNGTPSLTTDAGVVSTALQHVVYTRAADGTATFYVDGNAVGNGVISGTLAGQWMSNLYLALGNEMTSNREWLGEYRYVAIYSRALSPVEVMQNQDVGPESLEIPEGMPGDLNCDGVVDFADINPFVAALSGQAAYESAYPDCEWLNADINGDATVDFTDINPFIAVLSN